MTDNDELLIEDLDPKYRDFRFQGKTYRIREATEAAYIAYRAAATKGMNLQVTDGRSVATFDKDKDESDVVLVQKCLTELVNEKENPVTVEFLKSFTHANFTKLVEWVKRVSNMVMKDDKKDDKTGPKDVTPAITTTSG